MPLPSLTLMHLTGSNDMLQSLETEGSGITISATEGFSMSEDTVSNALLHVHFLTALSFLVL